MSAVVTDKQTGSARNVAGDTVVLSGASVITVQASPEDIASYQRSGDDLVLRFQDGRIFRIVNFYVAGEGATENDLVLQDENGTLWAGQHSDGLADFSFAEIQNVDQLILSLIHI